ncbi:hypothetical protein [Kosakonia sacchari]|uniref:hypothetical protein n=1 Tax=Kosakonia sacchari TaxID=1158459 RepID=UPI0015851DA5|nr:hypothetical protein [Kosakonia sacchari]NUL35078.1 hypothetical protein [Kosakonia sacchari]
MGLEEYIEKYYGGVKVAFARANETSPQQVQKWKRNGYLMDEKTHTLCIPHRQMAVPGGGKSEQ